MEAEKKIVGRRTIKVGLWGGHGGTSWDDGSFNGVREITLVYDRCIDSIRVKYDKNGKPVQGEKHGGNGGHRTASSCGSPQGFLFLDLMESDDELTQPDHNQLRPDLTKF
ncbi:Mannose-binding lectin [Macleaya cordata]|uniref:Mannose-binding lectin n=1 Tax=Macleaya cordata TaxID=56857 RepID=A0A200QMQ3_MACCD|nr:Mannose-binding lectin [Macleaya cordata]